MQGAQPARTTAGADLHAGPAPDAPRPMFTGPLKSTQYDIRPRLSTQPLARHFSRRKPSRHCGPTRRGLLQRRKSAAAPHRRTLHPPAAKRIMRLEARERRKAVLALSAVSLVGAQLGAAA